MTDMIRKRPPRRHHGPSTRIAARVFFLQFDRANDVPRDQLEAAMTGSELLAPKYYLSVHRSTYPAGTMDAFICERLYRTCQNTEGESWENAAGQRNQRSMMDADLIAITDPITSRPVRWYAKYKGQWETFGDPADVAEFTDYHGRGQ